MNAPSKQHVALASLATARDSLEVRENGTCLICGGVLDQNAALYWAFVAGQQAAGKDYAEAKREAAALGLVPPCLQDAEALAS